MFVFFNLPLFPCRSSINHRLLPRNRLHFPLKFRFCDWIVLWAAFYSGLHLPHTFALWAHPCFLCGAVPIIHICAYPYKDIDAHGTSFFQSENFCFGGTAKECRQSRHNIWIAAKSPYEFVSMCVCVSACVHATRSTGVGCGVLGVSLAVKLEQK